MSKLYFMIAISERDRLPDFLDAINSGGADVSFVSLGHGTAAHLPGRRYVVSGTEKAVSTALVTDETWLKIKAALENKVRIDIPGTGIALTVPVSAVGGRREFAFLTAGQEFVKEEETELKSTQRELIVAICEQGYTETVMDAARDAGARGGTVINAKGTGVSHAERFLGITLASEKAVVLIAVSAGEKAGIMSSIMQKAGVETAAKAICFSLPVTDAAGFRIAENEE